MGIDRLSIFWRREFWARMPLYLDPPSESELCAEMRCAIKMGMAVNRTTNMAVTLVTGLLRGLSIWLYIQMGSVCCKPAVNVVTITSSKESEKARIPPASSAVAMFGKITCQNV